MKVPHKLNPQCITGNTVYLLSIYDKSELDNITDITIKERLKELE